MRSLRATLTSNAVAESSHPDAVSALARRVAESIAALCPNVPPEQCREAATRLAVAELASLAGDSFPDECEADAAPVGNQVVWLPGPTAAAIILPAGEEPPSAASRAAELLAALRHHSQSRRVIASRGLAALRQAGAALVSAYQARPRAQ